jgi:hypothetical protein
VRPRRPAHVPGGKSRKTNGPRRIEILVPAASDRFATNVTNWPSPPRDMGWGVPGCYSSGYAQLRDTPGPERPSSTSIEPFVERLAGIPLERRARAGALTALAARRIPAIAMPSQDDAASKTELSADAQSPLSAATRRPSRPSAKPSSPKRPAISSGISSREIGVTRGSRRGSTSRAHDGPLRSWAYP